MSAVLETVGLTKHFGALTVANQISLSIEERRTTGSYRT